MAHYLPNYVFYREPTGYLACDIRLPDPGMRGSHKCAPHSLIRAQVIKEMPPEHRRIIMQFVMHCSENSPHNVLQGSYGLNMAKTIIMTKRGYWLKEGGKALKWGTPYPAKLSWTPHTDKTVPPLSANFKAAKRTSF